MKMGCRSIEAKTECRGMNQKSHLYLLQFCSKNFLEKSDATCTEMKFDKLYALSDTSVESSKIVIALEEKVTDSKFIIECR